MNKLFSRFSWHASKALGSSYTFLLALIGVIIWAALGRAFHYSENWQMVINTSTTIITFLSVFLIQNSQNRSSLAMQLKLDELVLALKEARNDMINVENLSDEDLEKLEKEFQRLCKKEINQDNNTP